MPAIALLTTNSVKFRERPHSKQPKPKTVYAKRRQLFLPNISLNLPYNGLGFPSEFTFIARKYFGSNSLEARNCQEIRSRDPTRVLKLIQFAPN